MRWSSYRNQEQVLEMRLQGRCGNLHRHCVIHLRRLRSPARVYVVQGVQWMCYRNNNLAPRHCVVAQVAFKDTKARKQ